MINRIMEGYMLQSFESVRVPPYNHIQEKWVDVVIISVGVNEKYTTVRDNEGNTYGVKLTNGITKYDKLDKAKKYRIKNSNHKYEIDDFIIACRWTQLTIKEVSDG